MDLQKEVKKTGWITRVHIVSTQTPSTATKWIWKNCFGLGSRTSENGTTATIVCKKGH